MRNIVMLSVVFAITLFAFDWYGKVRWAMNWESAKMIAKQQNKIIMVDIASNSCPYCKLLAKHYQDEEVASYINKRFVPLIYVDRPLPREVARHFRGGVPAILFFSPDGKLKKYLVGYYPKKYFLKILESIR